MKLNEAMKQATPGPWAREKHTIDSVDVPHLDGPMGSCVVSVGGNCNVSVSQRSANAALICHMRNTYERLVEALDSALRTSPISFPEGERILEEAEEVPI
jgi:hypothetical protein